MFDNEVARIHDLRDARAKDLDETRRLLYMALVAFRTEKYNLVGTLMNALAHHSEHRFDPNEVASKVIAALDGKSDGLTWVSERIAELTT